MKELMEKISSYHIFNYLVPGVVFVSLLKTYTSYNIVVPENIFVMAFLYYFVGLVVSRIGSLVLDPILKKIKFVIFADYKDYTVAEKEDSAVSTLSEVNNMYRSLASVFFLLILSKIYELIIKTFPTLYPWTFSVLFLLLLVMFLFAYRKQTSYVKRRVDKIIQK